MPATNLRNIRVADELWSKAGNRASDEGITLSALVRQWLQDYVDDVVDVQPKVRLTQAERDAVWQVLAELDITGMVVDAINKERSP